MWSSLLGRRGGLKLASVPGLRYITLVARRIRRTLFPDEDLILSSYILFSGEASGESEKTSQLFGSTWPGVKFLNFLREINVVLFSENLLLILPSLPKEYVVFAQLESAVKLGERVSPLCLPPLDFDLQPSTE